MNSQLKKTLNKAQNCAENEEYDDALKLCNEIISGDMNQAEGYRERAAVYSLMGEYQSAVKDLISIFKLGSEEPADYYELGNIRFKQGCLDETIEALTNCIDLSEKYDFFYYKTACYFLRAEANLRLNKFKEALEDCQNLDEDYKYYIPSSGMKTRSKIIEQAKFGINQSTRKTEP